MATVEAPAADPATNGSAADIAPATPTGDLTPKQAQVLALHDEGKSASEIADVMGITANGVHNHLGRLKKSGHIAGGSTRRSSGGGGRRTASHAGDATKNSALSGVRASLKAARAKLTDVKAIEADIKSLETAFKALGGTEE